MGYGSSERVGMRSGITSVDRERSLGQGITNCVYTNNRFELQSRFHATQSDLYLLILSMCLLVDICRSGAVTQDFILRTAPIFSFSI